MVASLGQQIPGNEQEEENTRNLAEHQFWNPRVATGAPPASPQKGEAETLLNSSSLLKSIKINKILVKIFSLGRISLSLSWGMLTCWCHKSWPGIFPLISPRQQTEIPISIKQRPPGLHEGTQSSQQHFPAFFRSAIRMTPACSSSPAEPFSHFSHLPPPRSTSSSILTCPFATTNLAGICCLISSSRSPVKAQIGFLGRREHRSINTRLVEIKFSLMVLKTDFVFVFSWIISSCTGLSSQLGLQHWDVIAEHLPGSTEQNSDISRPPNQSVQKQGQDAFTFTAEN